MNGPPAVQPGFRDSSDKEGGAQQPPSLKQIRPSLCTSSSIVASLKKHFAMCNQGSNWWQGCSCVGGKCVNLCMTTVVAGACLRLRIDSAWGLLDSNVCSDWRPPTCWSRLLNFSFSQSQMVGLAHSFKADCCVFPSSKWAFVQCRLP